MVHILNEGRENGGRNSRIVRQEEFCYSLPFIFMLYYQLWWGLHFVTVNFTLLRLSSRPVRTGTV